MHVYTSPENERNFRTDTEFDFSLYTKTVNLIRAKCSKRFDCKNQWKHVLSLEIIFLFRVHITPSECLYVVSRASSIRGPNFHA